jgi:surface polysaccharide O-acyltransferase-like enzyme
MLMNAIGTSVFVPIVAVNVFRCFLSLKIKNNDIVNKISATTFGIYLLHDSITARGLIWYRILDLPRQQYMSPLYPLMACLTILVLFAVCSAFDLLRMKMVLPIDRKIDIHILGYKRIIFLKNSNNIGDDGNTENIN